MLSASSIKTEISIFQKAAVYTSNKRHSIVHKCVHMATMLHAEDSFKLPHVAAAVRLLKVS